MIHLCLRIEAFHAYSIQGVKVMQTATQNVADVLKQFVGDPQRATPIASFLGFKPIASPEDQLAGPLRGGLRWFFAQRSDNFGVHELYRVGSYDAKPGSVGIYVAVLTEWGLRSTDRDRPRRRIARSLVEQVPDARSMVILVPNEIERRHTKEAEFVLPRSAAAVGRGADGAAAVSSVRALVDLEQPNRFHRDLLRDLVLWPGASLLEVSQHWQKIFSVERVTTRFYDEYRKVRDRMADALLSHNADHLIVGKLTIKDARAWATRQMGRMLFLWFLQSKRWLGEPGGHGHRDYLVRLWQRRHQASVQEYYRGLLVPLFFEGMAVGTPSETVRDLLGYTPYLNGGLFRKNRLEDDVDRGGCVSLPDEVFDPDIASNEPHTVLSLLTGYRFTTRESTPDDQSVDPDPELLGRVFENLYQGDERKNTGTYYTPREIVHFMCRQALDGYLRDQTGATQEKLDWLRKQVVEKEEQREPLPRGLEERLVEALELIRVCDPAVGSGAFLLGMMQEMVLLRRGIEHAKREYIPEEEDLITNWKRHAIHYSLYGVDINPEAVEICQLRLWLSLVLDLLEPPRDAPLPNLDFRIVAGDSLVDRVADITFIGSWPPKETTVGLELRHRVGGLVTSIARWRQEFDSTHRNPQRLKDLRDRVARAQSRIIWLHLEDAMSRAEEEAASAEKKNAQKKAQARVEQLYALIADLDSRDFALVQKPFLWPVAFPDILQQGRPTSGFDIVLANPPYVRMEKIDNTDEQAYGQAFPEVKASRADILVYFYARALQILRPGGWLAFITSNKYMRAAYGEDLRGYLPRSMAIDRVLDFGDLPLFEANGKVVSSYPSVLIGRKNGGQEQHVLHVADLTYPVRRELAKREVRVNPENVRWVLEDLGGLLEENEVPDYPQVLLRKEGWILEDPALLRLFHRLMSQGTPLGEFVKGRIHMGVKTGLNEAFVIDQSKRDELVAEDPTSAEIIKPWLRGKDIRRWRAEWAGLHVIFTNRGVDMNRYPAVLEHLRWFRPKLEKRATSHLHPWYELQQPQEGIYAEFEQPKVIWPDITSSMRFAWDNQRHYLGNTAYVGIGPKWLVSLLNSTLLEFAARTLSTAIRGGYIRLIYNNVTPLPIMTPPKATDKQLEQIAERHGPDSQVDEVVNGVYHLSTEEARLLRNWKSRQEEMSSGKEDEAGAEDDE